MRKLLTLISLLVALSLVLTACGGGTTPTEAPAATEPAIVTEEPAATEPPAATEEPAATEPAASGEQVTLVIESWRNDVQDASGFIHRHDPRFDALRKRSAVHVAHHEVGLSICLADVIHRHDGRVFQLCDDLGFPLEAQAELRIGMQQFAGQYFDGDLALKARIIGQVNCCHPPAPQLGFDFVDAYFFGLHNMSSIPTPKYECKLKCSQVHCNEHTMNA